jgi:hypothetical protein
MRFKLLLLLYIISVNVMTLLTQWRILTTVGRPPVWVIAIILTL